MNYSRWLIIVFVLSPVALVAWVMTKNVSGFQAAKPVTASQKAADGLIAIDWDILGLVKPNQLSPEMSEEFDPRIKALDGKKVKLTGFMLPSSASREQTLFLISRNSSTCFFCLPGGPESLVMVHAVKPVTYVYDPVTVTGRFKLPAKPGDDIFYEMEDAVGVK
ncbi:MAG: DUF3299 domain-containing protein [Nitrospinae bacterium]|nr:DUF3299 domain-containing protein [Nitrospinota bacterium]